MYIKTLLLWSCSNGQSGVRRCLSGLLTSAFSSYLTFFVRVFFLLLLLYYRFQMLFILLFQLCVFDDFVHLLIQVLLIPCFETNRVSLRLACRLLRTQIVLWSWLLSCCLIWAFINAGWEVIVAAALRLLLASCVCTDTVSFTKRRGESVICVCDFCRRSFSFLNFNLLPLWTVHC